MIRCIDGRLLKHQPFPNDPDFERDVGECPQCSGHGCDRPRLPQGRPNPCDGADFEEAEAARKSKAPTAQPRESEVAGEIAEIEKRHADDHDGRMVVYDGNWYRGFKQMEERWAQASRDRGKLLTLLRQRTEAGQWQPIEALSGWGISGWLYAPGEGVAGDKAMGSRAYLEGHTYACMECQHTLFGAGVISLSVGIAPGAHAPRSPTPA
jgi:hypothetical protein